MRLLLVLLAALMLPVVPAAADGGAFRDPEEEPFCEGPGECPDNDYMDFRRLTYGHGDAGKTLRHGVYTLKRWKTRRLGGRHGTSITIRFDTDGDRLPERRLEIRRKDGELWAGMFRGKDLLKPVRGEVRVWRPNRRSVKVAFRPALLDERVRYRWYVEWSDRGLACAGSCQSDHAPQRGWFTHEL
jgi:hypothetical protein